LSLKEVLGHKCSIRPSFINPLIVIKIIDSSDKLKINIAITKNSTRYAHKPYRGTNNSSKKLKIENCIK